MRCPPCRGDMVGMAATGRNWFNDPSQRLVALAMTQTTDVLFNGAMNEFAKLATNALRS